MLKREKYEIWIISLVVNMKTENAGTENDN